MQLDGQRCEVIQADRFGTAAELKIVFPNSQGAPLPGTPNALLFEAQREWGRELPQNLANQITVDAKISYDLAHPGYSATQARYASDCTEMDFEGTEDPVEVWEREFGDAEGGEGAS